MAQDLTISLGEDRPGALASALEAIGGAGINVDGVCEVEGTLHVLVEDLAGARGAVEQAGFEFRAQRDVVVIAVEDRPGEGGRLLRRIAEAGINVEFAYVATNTRLVIGTSNVEGARAALGS